MTSGWPSHSARGVTFVAIATCMPFVASAKEDIEFVQEHLPEVAMDDRYATLPVWSSSSEAGGDEVGIDFQSAFSATKAGDLEISGPLFAIGSHWQLNPHWSIGAFAFYDPLRLKSTREQRDLQTLFAPSTPIVRPVAAEFRGLDGTATDIGLGVNVAWQSDAGFLGMHRWICGVLWQQMKLEDYRFDYRIMEGPQAGTTGTIDFDATYTHVVPFAGLEVLRDYGRWTTNAHALLAYPLPRRGVVGHITGPGFDIHGDTADVGNGKHFGDPSVTFGYTVTYRPAHLSFDLGTLVAQRLLEPKVHRGIESNILLSISLDW